MLPGLKLEIILIDQAGYLNSEGHSRNPLSCSEFKKIQKLQSYDKDSGPGLNITQYYKYDDFIREYKPDNGSNDIFFIALPPYLHYRGMRDAVRLAMKSDNGIVAGEKPFAVPDTYQKTCELVRTYQSRIVDVDFFSKATSLLFFQTDEGRDILHALGVPAVLNGRCIERKREWRNLARLYSKKWGGGGAFLDCGSHNITQLHLIMAYIESLQGSHTYSIDQVSVREARLARYHNMKNVRETFALVGLRDEHRIYNILNGKYAPATAYDFEIFSTSGNLLLVSVGTEKRPPFVYFHEKRKDPRSIVFDSPGVGYGGVFASLLELSSNGNTTLFPNPNISMRGALKSAALAEEVERKGGRIRRYDPRSWPKFRDGKPWRLPTREGVEGVPNRDKLQELKSASRIVWAA